MDGWMVWWWWWWSVMYFGSWRAVANVRCTRNAFVNRWLITFTLVRRLSAVTLACAWWRADCRCRRVFDNEWNLFKRSLWELHGRIRVPLWPWLWTYSTENILSRSSRKRFSSSFFDWQKLLCFIAVRLVTKNAWRHIINIFIKRHRQS